MYRIGLGIDENYSTEVISFCKAAEQGNAHAINYFGMMNEYGNGVNKNYFEVFDSCRICMYIYIYIYILISSLI